MNTSDTTIGDDAQLRAMLAELDPEAGREPAATDHLLGRVLADPARPQRAGATAPGAPGRGPGSDPRSWWHRHWEGSLLVAASIATLALAAPTVLPGLTTGGSDDAAETASIGIAEGAPSAPDMRGTDGSVTDSAAGGARESDAASVGVAPGTTTPAEESADTNTLVRSASMLVGTEDVDGGRNAFVATILAMGGRVTSETVVTEDSGRGGAPVMGGGMGEDMMVSSYPYPWYPSGPGVWLTVEVPAEDYDRAVEAARATGEVVQMQQSSYDVGSQVADVDGRIEALEASLARLTALMDEAKDISDVIALEQAIAQRQAELDALRSQQRQLANQTAMSQISLTLMSPEDARQSVDPQPEQQSWWESFLEGLGQFWSWLGNALLIVSPLLIAGAIIWWVRRRRARSTGRGGSTAGGSGGTDPRGAGTPGTDTQEPDTQEPDTK